MSCIFGVIILVEYFWNIDFSNVWGLRGEDCWWVFVRVFCFILTWLWLSFHQKLSKLVPVDNFISIFEFLKWHEDRKNSYLNLVNVGTTWTWISNTISRAFWKNPWRIELWKSCLIQRSWPKSERQYWQEKSLLDSKNSEVPYE